MIPDLILFFGLALVAIASALGMIFSRSAVYSALNLVVNFGAISFFYLILGAPFISLAQVAVYTGAIMVLFLFVIMLLGGERHESPPTTLPWQRPLAFGLGILLLLEAVYVAVFKSGYLPLPGTLQLDFGSPVSVGEIMLNQYLLPFEVISVLLLVAMVGAIVLTKRRNGG